MTTKVRAITYSFDFKLNPSEEHKYNIMRRWVGQKININTESEKYQIEIVEIVESYNQTSSMNEYGIIVSNGIERALWKTIRCMNMEVEYNIEDLLT
jgi:hypothetical protein